MPPVEISIFDWRVMSETMLLLPPPPALLQQLFFTRRRTWSAEHIDFDKVWADRKILPFVSDVAGGTVVSGTRREARSVRTPRLRPKRPFPAAELLTKRASGSSVYTVGANGPEAAMQQKLNLELRHLRNRVDYTIEYYCSQALTGSISVSQPNMEYAVDYLMPSEHKIVLEAGKRWGDVGVDPGEDLLRWADLILDATGEAPDTCVMGTDAALKFENNESVLKKLDIRRVEMGALSPTVKKQYLGTYRGIDLYKYGGSVTDEYGNTLTYWNPKRVCLGNSQSPCSIEFGLILDLDADISVEAQYFVKSFTKPDPSVLYVLAESRPLPVPYQPESFVNAIVLE